MKNEIRKDLFTQNEYASLIGKDKSTVNRALKRGKYNTLEVVGTVLIKVSEEELKRLRNGAI